MYMMDEFRSGFSCIMYVLALSMFFYNELIDD